MSRLTSALRSLPLDDGHAEPVAAAEVTLIGPFPAYVVAPRDLLTTGVETAERSGWRALVEALGTPTALVDISVRADGDVTYAYRGADAARSFSAVLAAAAELGNSQESYDVRWLTVPDVYVTALWFAGERPWFLPTRLGEAERPPLESCRVADLQNIVQRLVAAARPSPDDRRSAFFGRTANQSPRSGLPE